MMNRKRNARISIATIMILMTTLFSYPRIVYAELTITRPMEQFNINDLADTVSKEQEQEMLSRAIAITENPEGISILAWIINFVCAGALAFMGFRLSKSYKERKEEEEKFEKSIYEMELELRTLRNTNNCLRDEIVRSRHIYNGVNQPDSHSRRELARIRAKYNKLLESFYKLKKENDYLKYEIKELASKLAEDKKAV